MNTQRKLASYPCFFEHIPMELPQNNQGAQNAQRRMGRRPKYPRLTRQKKQNVLDNVE